MSTLTRFKVSFEIDAVNGGNPRNWVQDAINESLAHNEIVDEWQFELVVEYKHVDIARYKVSFEIDVDTEINSHPRTWIPETINEALNPNEYTYEWQFDEVGEVPSFN